MKEINRLNIEIMPCTRAALNELKQYLFLENDTAAFTFIFMDYLEFKMTEYLDCVNPTPKNKKDFDFYISLAEKAFNDKMPN